MSAVIRRSRPSVIFPAVAATVAALEVRAEDAGLVRLVERYAAVIDEAARIAGDAAKVRPEDADTAKLLRALQQRVEAQAVLAELGPKLLAALEALGASPKARAGLRKGGVVGDGSAQSKLDELRARRAARQR